MLDYLSLMKAVTDSFMWGEWTILHDMELNDRIDKIKEIFFVACRNKHDKTALKLYQWFLCAISDVKLLPFVKKEKDREFLPETSEIYKVQKEVWAEQTAKTMELYDLLPFYKKQWPSRDTKKDKIEMIGIDSPVLLETKKVMLEVIAKRWRDTEDEQEADKIFNFLWQVPTEFDQDSDIKLKAIRKATDERFPVKRLTRHIVALLNVEEQKLFKDDRERIIKILAKARSRNREPERAASELKIIQHTEDFSSGAYHFLEKKAQEISEFDAEARELKQMMQSGKYDKSVYGEINLSYLKTQKSDLLLLIVLIERKLQHIESDIPEVDLHQQFERARDYVLQWRSKYSSRKVKLVLSLKDERPRLHSSPQKFSRDQSFS